MKYIWINPVVMQMYEAEGINLHKVLKDLGYWPLIGNANIIECVKQQFVLTVKEKKGTVLDTRCPLAIEKIKKECSTEGFYIPEIYPILIQTSFDLYERYINQDESSTLDIMCPCQKLSELGNKLAKVWEKERITFYSWNKWVESLKIYKAKAIHETPIPLGFFDELGIKVKSITGEKRVVEEVSSYQRTQEKSSNDSVDLIEMLYCKGGCHNGNGVI